MGTVVIAITGPREAPTTGDRWPRSRSRLTLRSSRERNQGHIRGFRTRGFAVGDPIESGFDQ